MGGSLTWQGSDNRTQGQLTATRDALNEETTQLYAASITLLSGMHSWVGDSGSPTSSPQQPQVTQVQASVRSTLVQVTTGAVLAQTISACLALAQVRVCPYSCCPVRCTRIIVPSPCHTLASKYTLTLSHMFHRRIDLDRQCFLPLLCYRESAMYAATSQHPLPLLFLPGPQGQVG